MERFYIAQKAGSLRGGWTGGTVWHAVSVESESPLCSSGNPSINYCSDAGTAVTCPKCLKRLATLGDHAFVEGVPVFGW